MADPQAFAAFYDEHAESLFRFMARRTFDVETARDLTAEAFAQAFTGRKRFRGRTDLEATAWLYAIARHLFSRYARKGVVERTATRKLGIRIPPIGEDEYDRVVEMAGLSEARGAVSNAFDRLPRDQRDAVRLRVVEELTYPEIAARLDITEPTARARVSRGLRTLAAVLDASPQIREMTT